MMRKSIGVLLVLSLLCAVSCTRQKQAEQADECRSVARAPYKDFEIVICSNGDRFTSEKQNQWSGDNIKIYRQRGREKTLLRDFEETAFGSMHGVNIEARDRELAVTVFSDHFPDWGAAPLFTELIRPDTGASTIAPLVPVPPYDPKIVGKLWADINKNERDMFPGEGEDSHSQKFFDLVYGNLFKLRDYGFRDPKEIEKKLKTLETWDWNDGEIAEVYAQILSQVSYIKGKQVILK